MSDLPAPPEITPGTPEVDNAAPVVTPEQRAGDGHEPKAQAPGPDVDSPEDHVAEDDPADGKLPEGQLPGGDPADGDPAEGTLPQDDPGEGMLPESHRAEDEPPEGDPAEGEPPEDDPGAPDLATTGPTASGGRSGGISVARNVVEWLTILGGALVVALVVTRFLVQAFFIPSLSMFPALDNGDRVLVNKLSYRLHEIHRGDLIVFQRPADDGSSQVKDLIKRVVALEGERIEARDGRVVINGKALPEPYLAPNVQTTNLEPLVVPEGHVFVMGDNRGDSRDSRFFGPLPEDLVIGRAFVKVWPLDDLELL